MIKLHTQVSPWMSQCKEGVMVSGDLMFDIILQHSYNWTVLKSSRTVTKIILQTAISKVKNFNLNGNIMFFVK